MLFERVQFERSNSNATTFTIERSALAALRHRARYTGRAAAAPSARMYCMQPRP